MTMSPSRSNDWSAEEGGCGYCCSICVDVYAGGDWLHSLSIPDGKRTEDSVYAGNTNKPTVLLLLYYHQLGFLVLPITLTTSTGYISIRIYLCIDYFQNKIITSTIMVLSLLIMVPTHLTTTLLIFILLSEGICSASHLVWYLYHTAQGSKQVHEILNADSWLARHN